MAGLLTRYWDHVKFFVDNIWLFAVLFVSGGMLVWPHLQNRGQRLSPLQATQKINHGKTVIVDVRDSEAFAASHIRDAINIPLKDLSSRIGELAKHKAKTVIVVCQSGAQSSRATTQLNREGFEQAYSLEGGLAAWQAQGLPVVK